MYICREWAGNWGNSALITPQDLENSRSRNYVNGYMVPYSDNNWADWFKQFTLQTGCEYTIRSGKQSNTLSRETGVIQMEG